MVQDFEKTLERSRTKSVSVEPEDGGEEPEVRRRTFDSRTASARERFFMEYGEFSFSPEKEEKIVFNIVFKFQNKIMGNAR